VEASAEALRRDAGLPSEGRVDPAAIATLVAWRAQELSPVAAIVGAMAANEVVKVVTRRDAPLNNFLLFDGMEGEGGRVYAL
jgi:ubiquitin-like 1-activating enzyme E1 A